MQIKFASSHYLRFMVDSTTGFSEAGTVCNIGDRLEEIALEAGIGNGGKTMAFVPKRKTATSVLVIISLTAGMNVHNK